MFFVGEENFLKEVFLPPHPYPSKTFKRGVIFLVYIVRSTNKRTMFALTYAWKFSPAFFKRRRSQGREALVALRRVRNSPIVRKTQERVNFFACKERGRTLVGGSPLIVLLIFFVGKGNFLKKVFLSPHPYLQKLSNVILFFCLHYSLIDK